LLRKPSRIHTSWTKANSPHNPSIHLDIDNRELERVKREAKRDEEWEVRARQVEEEEQTLHHLKVEEAKKKKEKRLKEDKYMDNAEHQRVVREAKRDEEWEVRAREIERAEQTIHHLKVEEEKRLKEKRLQADKCKLATKHRYR
jgi:hypothetical protein